MSSEPDIQSILEFIVLNDYLSFASVIVVGYDYILTFSRELDYIWFRPWTWVSTMFIVVRYIGLYWVMSSALFGSSFVPGPIEVGKALYLANVWVFLVFLSTADLLMILRVYAMWNRSRVILFILLSVYTAQTIVTIIFEGIYNNPYTHLPVITTRILGYSFCTPLPDRPLLLTGVHYVALRLVLGIMLTILAVLQTMKQSFQMYKATRQWQPNRYIQKLVKDGILYFVVNMLYQTNDLLDITRYSSSDAFIYLEVLAVISFYILIPRFVVNIRELYDNDMRGFGVQSQPNAGLGTTVSTIEFMDRNRGSEVASDTGIAADPEAGQKVYGSGSNERSLIGGSE